MICLESVQRSPREVLAKAELLKESSLLSETFYEHIQGITYLLEKLYISTYHIMDIYNSYLKSRLDCTIIYVFNWDRI